MIVEKNRGGYWVISDIIAEKQIMKKYLYYTKREAIRLFKKECKEIIKQLNSYC